MKLNYYISDLRNSLSKDNSNVDDRMLIELINQFRSNYIKSEFSRNRYIPNGMVQTISGISMNLSDQIDVDFIDDDTRILKSDVTIPEPIHILHKDLITRVWDGLLLNTSFSYITPEEAIYAGNGKTNRKAIYTFRYNGNLYIKLKPENRNINLITNASIRGIFENPLDLIPLQYDTYIDSLDYEYPITKSAWGQIKSNILKSSFNIIQSEINEAGE